MTQIDMLLKLDYDYMNVIITRAMDIITEISKVDGI